MAGPIGPATGDYVDYPDANSIIAAAKVTGRLQSKTSLGLIAAVTDDEDARVASGNPLTRREVAVAPHAYHFIGRMLQEFGPSASTAGFSSASLGTGFETAAGTGASCAWTATGAAAASRAASRIGRM